jgi:hypothetical protein
VAFEAWQGQKRFATLWTRLEQLATGINWHQLAATGIASISSSAMLSLKFLFSIYLFLHLWNFLSLCNLGSVNLMCTWCSHFMEHKTHRTWTNALLTMQFALSKLRIGNALATPS